jgi:tetratricopeptide (TPR) repeat protein
MNAVSCARYQKRAITWTKVFLISTVLFSLLLILYSADSDAALITGILGVIFSLTGILTAWLFKKYYKEYERVLVEFEKLPPLATWTVPHQNWSDYQRIEKEFRKRELLKYILWSPLLIGFIGIMIWSEVDDLSFDSNLILWGVGGYAVMMVLLYIQMKMSMNKTHHTQDHVIVLKTVGARIDDNITFWGKITAETHDSLSKSMSALLFAKSDEDRKVNRTYIHEEGGLNYVVINYNMDENNQRDLFLPLPKEKSEEVSEKLGLIQSDTVFEKQTSVAHGGQYNTKKYLKWMVGSAAVFSTAFWVYDQGLPIYYQWKSEQLFDEGVMLYNSGQSAEALKKYQASIREYDGLPEAYLNIGTIYMNDGNLDSALHYYNLTLERSPAFDLALFNKGVVLYNQNKYRAMVDVLYQYEKAAPKDHEHDLMMGDAFYNLNLVDSAYYYYHRAEQENKRSSALSYMLGRIMMDKQNWQEAEHYLQEAIQQDSTLADGHLLLSDIYQQLGNDALSDLHYEKGVRLQTFSH